MPPGALHWPHRLRRNDPASAPVSPDRCHSATVFLPSLPPPCRTGCPPPCRSCRAASTGVHRPTLRRSCSTSCWCETMVALAASSRLKPMPAATIPPRTPIAGQRRARPACSVRPATSMSTSRTACTGAATWSAERSVKAWRCCCGPSSRWRAWSACTSCRPAARRDHDLASGPGKLSQAFGLDRSFDGADLVTGSHGIVIASDGTPPPSDPEVGPRIGITRAVDFPWRWHVRDHRHVSVRRRHISAPARRR